MSASSVLDFGAGRGWFLDVARESGFTKVAGADTSPVAVESLRSRGIDAVLLKPDESPAAVVDRIPFRPQLLTMLDVVEHLPPVQLEAALGGLIRRLRPEVQLVIVKVPVISGLFYRTASALRAFGACGPIEQLYQVGTSPPHQSYFSRRSMLALLRRVGLDSVRTVGDRDFEPESLAQRARPLQQLSPKAVRLLGAIACAAIETLRCHDSLIFLGRPSGAAAM